MKMVVNASIMEIYDMNTHIGKLGLIGVHTPRYDLLFKHLFGFFVQYKRWKYNGATISLVPAAQLPSDVAGVSLEAGSQTVDPRDLFNPILHKGFTGESLGSILDEYLTLNSERGDSLTYAWFDQADAERVKPNFENAYYQMLTHGGFQKMMPLSSITGKFVYPMVYDMATTRQLTASWKGAYFKNAEDGLSYVDRPITEINAVVNPAADSTVLSPNALSDKDHGVTGFGAFETPVVFGKDVYSETGKDTIGWSDVPIITPRKRKLGWMDTLNKVLPVDAPSGVNGNLAFDGRSEPYTFSGLPKLFEYLFVTPPSYYNKLYYRMVIRHHVSFAGQRSAIGAGSAISSLQTNYYNFMEQLPAGGGGTASASSLEALGADVIPVTDGLQS